jgi:uncharacterized protein (DUF885 family)
MKKLFVLLVLALALYSCQNKAAKNDNAKTSTALHTILHNYYEDYLKLNTIDATTNGDNRYNDKLYATFTDSHRQKVKDFLEKYKAQIKDFDRETLNQADKINYDCFIYDIDRGLEALNFHSNYIPLEQIGGFHLLFAQLGSGTLIQPFATVTDYDNWLKRMEAFGPYMDSVIVYFKKGMDAKTVLPKALVEKMIPQMKSMAVADVTKSIFYQPIAKMPASFSPADKERLTKAYINAITTIVNPAYLRTGEFLQNEYLPVARTTSGIWDTPDGKAYYDYCVRSQTSTQKSAEEIYNIGLSEVKRIRTQMDSIKLATGFTGDLNSFFHYLSTDPKFMPFTSSAEILATYNNIHERMKPQLKKLFLHEPRTPFEIREIEAFRAKSASSQYFQGNAKEGRPGIFYVLILNPKKYNAVEEQMESLFLHEAIPGHHYQISLQQEDTTLPEFRRFGSLNAYTEGWALYCESLGKELGLYTDPYQYFGTLGAEMHRAIRLVVDAGMHSRKMTREEAIAYMVHNEQISEEAATIEIERYMAWPGQALGYKIGSLTIQRLRKECESRLGKNFNVAEFHDEVLKYGNMPLDVLEKHLREWAGGKG